MDFKGFFYANKLTSIFVVSLLIGIILRISYAFLPVWGDEIFFISTAKELFAHVPNLMIIHPPLGQFFYAFPMLLLGEQFLRAVPLLITFVLFYFAYIFVRDMLGENEAKLTIALMSILYLSIYMSTRIDLDGAVLALSNLLFIIFIWNYVKNKGAYNIGFASLFLFISLMIKLNGIIIVLPVALFIFLYQKDLKNVWTAISAIAATSLIALAVLYLFFPGVFQHYLSYGTSSLLITLLKRVRSFVSVTFNLGTPLLFLCIPMAVYLFKDWKNMSLNVKFLVFIAAIPAFIVLVLAPGGAPERYISVYLALFFAVFSYWIVRAKIFDSINLSTIFFAIMLTLPLLFAGVITKIWNFSMLKLAMVYFVPFSVLLLYYLLGKKTKFLAVLLAMFVAFNFYLTFVGEPFIYSKTLYPTYEYSVSNFGNTTYGSNDVVLCYNINNRFDSACEVDGRQAGLNEQNIIVLANFFRDYGDGKYPINADALEKLNNDYNLNRSFDFKGYEYSWVFVKKFNIS